MIFVGIMLASTMNAVFRRILRSGHLTFQNRAYQRFLPFVTNWRFFNGMLRAVYVPRALRPSSVDLADPILVEWVQPVGGAQAFRGCMFRDLNHNRLGVAEATG